MGATGMTGLRAWKFVATPGTVSLAATDFWVEYTAQKAEAGAELGVNIREIWEKTDSTKAQGVVRRKYMEDRLRDLKWNYVGFKGTLTLDESTASQRIFTDITLVSVSGVLESFNDSMEYELNFSYPLSGAGGGGEEIARTVVFGGKTVNAENFVVAYTEEDRTVFKPLFRAAPVRVPAGPGIQTITIQAILDSFSGASSLAKRQAAEAEIKAWNDTYVGGEGTLTIDGVSQGTCHLRSCSPGSLTMPAGFIVYELQFAKGYSS